MTERAKTEGRWPDFFIIGAAKCGTSAMYDYLLRHPRLFMSEIKETEYYSKESIHSKGPEWYRCLFLEAGGDQLCGEASTTYTRWPHTPDVPDRINRDAPDARFIYVMRHPVQRTFSHYSHHMRLGITMTFEEALAKDDIYVDCSKYMEQIRRYQRFFPRDRFLFLFHDEYRKDPREVLYKVQRFLGIEELDLVEEGLVFSNVTGADNFVRKNTTRKLRSVPLINSIAENMPQSWKDRAYSILKKSPIGRRLEGKHKIEPMLEETRDRLLKLFEPHTRDLEQYLGIELPSWRTHEIRRP